MKIGLIVILVLVLLAMGACSKFVSVRNELVAQRDYDKARKLPTELVAELSRVTARAHGIWAKARAENDFKSFAPTLEQIIALKQRVAECWNLRRAVEGLIPEAIEVRPWSILRGSCQERLRKDRGTS